MSLSLACHRQDRSHSYWFFVGWKLPVLSTFLTVNSGTLNSQNDSTVLDPIRHDIDRRPRSLGKSLPKHCLDLTLSPGRENTYKYPFFEGEKMLESEYFYIDTTVLLLVRTVSYLNRVSFRLSLLLLSDPRRTNSFFIYLSM